MRLYPRIVSAALAAALLAQLSACGTLLHPERRGQISGRIDPAIAVLDGIGILFFVIPGLIAFAVDFTTGAIYLPGSRHHAMVDPQRLREAVGSDGRVDRSRLRAILHAELGRDLPLDDPRLIESHATPQQLAGLGLRPTS